MTLLGAPVISDTAQDCDITHKTDKLSGGIDQSHSALALLKNSLSMPQTIVPA